MPEDSRPPKDWWQSCTSKVTSGDPEKICGYTFYHVLGGDKSKAEAATDLEISNLVNESTRFLEKNNVSFVDKKTSRELSSEEIANIYMLDGTRVPVGKTDYKRQHDHMYGDQNPIEDLAIKKEVSNMEEISGGPGSGQTGHTTQRDSTDRKKKIATDSTGKKFSENNNPENFTLSDDDVAEETRRRGGEKFTMLSSSEQQRITDDLINERYVGTKFAKTNSENSSGSTIYETSVASWEKAAKEETGLDELPFGQVFKEPEGKDLPIKVELNPEDLIRKTEAEGRKSPKVVE